MEVTTVEGHPNIAFTKYWGKRDEKINLPNNSSISMTLGGSALRTVTSVALVDGLKNDRVYINGELQKIVGNEISEKAKFMSGILEYMKKKAGTDRNFIIVSENTFPTGSGIASSASGAATLTFAVAKSLQLGLSAKEMSIIARQISGSACRSLYGGWVKWQKGEKDDGSDSYAVQIADERHWPEMIDIIAIVDPSKKKVSSSEGHARTLRTSVLYKLRPEYVEQANKTLEQAILAKEFSRIGEIIMRDSNNMHATMLDTWPPVIYLTSASTGIMAGIQELNESHGEIIAAYTFDAGPNAHIITTEKNRVEVNEMLAGIKGVQRTIESHAGPAPVLLKEKDSLIDEKTMEPKDKTKTKIRI
jgi:diphosphomevalonate decarboxylase